MTVPPAACSFHVCRLALCPAISMTPHASRWLRPVCVSSALENPIHKVHTCTHRTSLRCTLLGRCVRQRPCGEPPGRRCTVRRTPTCTHTASLSVRLLHEHTNTHTGALRLHGRRTRAGVLGSCSGRLTPTCSPLDGRRAASGRRIPPLAASPPRCCHRRLRRCRCRRGRRSCRAPQLDAYHCCCHRQRTCESRTGDSNRALGDGRRADADRERATRTRARRAEGTLNGGGWRRLGMDAVQAGLGRLSKL